MTSYARRDYRDALARVDSLLASPGLSPNGRSFLNRQRSLCQAALTGGKAPLAAKTPAGKAPILPVRTAADADCGPRALLLVCKELKVPANLANLESLRKVAGTTPDGTSLAGLAKAATSVGLKADGVQMDRNALSNLTEPAIAWSAGNHFIAVLNVNGDTATVHDPNKPGEEEMPLSGPTSLLARSGGMLLLVSKDTKVAAAVRRP